MCLDSEFCLLLDEEQVIPKDPEDITTARFSFHYVGFKPLPPGKGDGSAGGSGAGGGRDHIRKTELRFLEKRVEGMVPPDKRKLHIQFQVNRIFRFADSGNQLVKSVDVFLEGELLQGVHSAMSLGRDEKLGLMLKADLAGVDSPVNVFSSQGHDYVELLPQLSDEAAGAGTRTYDHTKYACFNLKLNLPLELLTFGDALESWRVSNLSVIVKPSGCHCANVAAELAHGLQLNKKLFTEGLGADMVIVAKDNDTIPCHGAILLAQSPVIQKMLTEGHFVEGSTRKIKMPEWTAKEVTAFLAFLYYGGMETPVMDASMNVALFKMGDYYEVKSLKDKMREVLLKRSARFISVDVGLRLYGLAKLMNEPELAGKAIEALSLPSDEAILGSELFQEMFPTTVGRELFLAMRWASLRSHVPN